MPRGELTVEVVGARLSMDRDLYRRLWQDDRAARVLFKP